MSRDERILQRKLSCQIRRIDGFIESVDSIIEADETIRLEIMGEELKEIKEKIEKLYDELFSLDEVDIDKESEAYDGSMNKIGSLRVKIENERKLKDKLADIKPNGSQANIKLPQFDLPIYDGDMGTWINFKELFLTTIDAHPGLTNIQKLQYSNSAVKGEAARLIRGFPLLSENYGQAWNTLLSRYDNPRELAYAQVSKIFSLRAIKNPSAKCLHEFMDVCNEAIRNLETLELKRNQLVDVILVHFLQQKLSENLRLDWELSVDNTLPSYDKFIAFISRHARSMSCAVKECSKREETTGSRFPKCQSYGMLIEKSDTCILCKSKHHPLYMCNLFCKMPLKEKLNVVKGHKLCFNCLGKGHFSWNCRLNQRCKVCKGKHHTMIHYDKPSTEGASAQVENTTPKEHESAINLTNTQQANCNDSHVLLATARIKIKNGLGKLCTCRALLDSGSQVTMITKGCCERLGLVQRKSDRMIIGVGGTPVQHSSSTVSVTFCPLNNSEEFSVEAVVTGVLTSEIPNFRLKDPNWPTLKNLKLADPEFYIQAPIDMILGAEIYTELMLNGSISLGEGLPMAINTRLGWVLLGKLMGTSESNTEVCNLSLQSEPELEFVMKRFWETESVPSPDLCTQDEDCERLFSNNHGRDSHGRYWVKLPFRQHRPLLGESREKALRRFLSLEGKLCKNVKLYDQYRGFMKEYEHLNHMERVPIAEVKRELCRCYYMPHHPEDADYQRILWRPSPEEPVVDYRLLTVTYGTTSAPFLAMRTLQQLAEDEGQNYPEASRVTLNDFYVDDLLTGAQTIAETKELIDQLKDLMKKGGFHLRKWNSNCHEIVSHVEEINEEKKINLEKGAISKILGIVWDHVQDTFRVNITLPEEVVTKRDLLSNIARIYDPLGFLSPTTVAMANLQRQTAVKEVEDLEGLPVYHRAILKENGEWPEVTKAIQCSYPKVFVGDGTHLYLLIEDVESLDGPNVRSVLYQYHIPHKKWIWRKVNGFAPIVISKSIVYASHDKRVYFVGGRIHSRGNKVTCTDNIVRVKLKEGRASVLVKSRKSPLTDLLVLAMTFAPSAFLFMLAETRDHSTYKVFSYHLLNKDWHLIGSDKIFWKEKFLSLQICYTNKKLLLFPRMQWEQHFCNLYNYRLQTDSWGCYTTIPILGEKEGYPKNINHFTIVQDWVRAVFVHAGKESKYLWKLNLKSKQWTELPTYVKYRDSQYTAVALDLVFILGPADKEHETAEKYLSFFKTRRCELPKFGLLPESTYDLLRSWLRFPSNLNQGSAAGGSHRKRRQFKQTDAFTRGMVIGLKRAGWSIRQIAADTHLGASTVHRLWRRWLEQGNVAIYRNAGETRVTSARVDRRILRQAVAAPQATCTAILQHVQDTLDHSISTRTISRRLVANGLHSCRPLRRLPLTPPNRRQRLEWCRARSTWMTEWHRVVFSDESRFCLSSDSRRVRVWRRRGERSNPAAIVERPTVRQRGVMVWGAIAYDSRSPLLRIQGTMTAQRYVDDVLRPVTQGVPNALYQQDNARPHTARISHQAQQDVQMLPWPPYSPDLSPIEHVWDIIGRRLHALPQPRSEDELWQMVEREWRAIPQDAIRTLIDSLPRRAAACIAVRGGPTCY
ncbi:hypothetical protein LAZ67_19000737 [Cordylochernes scorpioides]|uniref:Gag-pol polyprotein n=1 Tax=Cordylochernes scorpioides TaxID=51811 RepID=A0ABY6LIU3_9ARAC|nr:hypothetical protein LAZ67_19000737 [Cordylochernes scorpioides]